MPTDAACSEGFAFRRARADEGRAVADLYLHARRENLGAIPPVAHSDDSVREWFSTVLMNRDDVWVIEHDAGLGGFMALRPPDWLDQIYLRADLTGRGLGTALLEIARAQLGGRVQLWTFQSNTGARRFYERLGFEAVEQTDGDNEEGAPDVRYLLGPATPLNSRRGVPNA